MIDIFEDIKPEPKLYIANVKLKIKYRPNAKSKKIEVTELILDKIPIVLSDGKIPNKEYKDSFIHRVYNNYIKKGTFNKMEIDIVSISNMKFSSNLAYDFSK